jgi:hypothetical protein
MRGSQIQASRFADTRTKLSALWVFATLNYLYADVETLMDRSISINLTQGSLLLAGMLVETAIVMVLLSQFLRPGANRLANIFVGAINTIAVLASLLVATPAPYYVFFAAIEVASTTLIIWYAFTWPNHGGDRA